MNNIIKSFNNEQTDINTMNSSSHIIIYDTNDKITYIGSYIKHLLGINESAIGSNLHVKGLISAESFNNWCRMKEEVRLNKNILYFSFSFTPFSFPTFFNICLNGIILPLFNALKDICGSIVLFTPREKLSAFIMSLHNNKLKNIINTLSKREFEIFYYLCKNLTQNEIANILNITKGAISKTIGHNLLNKLDCQSSFELITLGKHLGIHLIHLIPKTEPFKLEMFQSVDAYNYTLGI